MRNESKLRKIIQSIVRELLDNELEEVTTTNDIAGYSTPFAFSSKKSKKKRKKISTNSTGYTMLDEEIDKKDILKIKKLPNDEDLRILTYRTLLEKFNQKYTKLSGAQKNLLREYINNVSNTNSLKDTLKEIVKGLKQDLKLHSKNLKDEYVVQTMRYLELLKELKKSGNKNKKVI